MRRLNHITNLCFVLLFFSNIQAQEPGNPSVKEPALRRELLKRVEQDQAIRNELISKGVEHPNKAILERMQTIDTANTKRMKTIVSQYGWPSPELVGRDGAEAAFLLVQHADLAFQKEMLPLVEKAYRRGGLSGQSYALLLDRVLLGEGKPQVFGTQAKRFEEWKGQEPALEPIEDEANVDKRRAEVGLPPLSEYRELLKRMYFPQSQGKPTATSVQSPPVDEQRPVVPASCPVTVPPTTPFTPPGEREMGENDKNFWLGTEKLWIALPKSGEVWGWLPRAPGHPDLTAKIFWGSVDFDYRKEYPPQLKVTGRRLDGDAPPLLVDKVTNALFVPHAAMLTGVYVPTPGCWEITGDYKGQKLSYVVWVYPVKQGKQ